MCFFPLPGMCPKAKGKKSSKSKRTNKKAKKESPDAGREATPYDYGHLPTPFRHGKSPQAMYLPGYSWYSGDWEDHQPVIVPCGQWKEYIETAKKTLESSQGNTGKINDAKTEITGKIKEVRGAVDQTFLDVGRAEIEVKNVIEGTHMSVKDTHAAVKEAQAALKEAQDTLKANHAAHVDKQKEYAADVARMRKLLEEQAKKSDEAERKRAEEQRIKEAVQQAQLQFEKQMRHKRGRAPSPSTSSSSSSSSTSYSSRRQRRREKEREQELREEAEANRKRWEDDNKKLIQDMQQMFINKEKYERQFKDEKSQLVKDMQQMFKKEKDELRAKKQQEDDERRVQEKEGEDKREFQRIFEEGLERIRREMPTQYPIMPYPPHHDCCHRDCSEQPPSYRQARNESHGRKGHHNMGGGRRY
ncbi:hypothetical protein F5Y16DRAFT_11609 [Xylariaceae sp. FL0255]|nr:hypothetical protein F5Y16DRAFT_11609 [Xylariaceae sp. FL0255]